MRLTHILTEDLKMELHRREQVTVCKCQRNLQVKEPGRHQPWCTDNPAYRAGDWN